MMSHWELLASFVIDQPASATRYLEPFAKLDSSEDPSSRSKTPIRPNPWTGVGTPVVILLGKVGNLARRRRILTKMLSADQGEPLGADACLAAEGWSRLQEEAVTLQRQLVLYTVPAPCDIIDIAGVETPVAHMQEMVQIYRLSGILELYTLFPEVARAEMQLPDYPVMAEGNMELQESLYDTRLQLAICILSIMSSVPETSSVITLQLLPLIIVSSALEPPPTQFRQDTASTGGVIPSTDPTMRVLMKQLMRESHAIQHWRTFLRGRMAHISEVIGLPTVSMAQKLVEEVWRRKDWEADCSLAPPERAHWLDVMIDLRLESLFG